jgi:flagellar basal body rod protein FlgB
MIIGDDAVVNKLAADLDMKVLRSKLIDSNIANEVVESPVPGRPDGNNVNIDEEMLKLTENNIQYNVSVQLLSKRLRQINDAFEIGRKLGMRR